MPYLRDMLCGLKVKLVIAAYSVFYALRCDDVLKMAGLLALARVYMIGRLQVKKLGLSITTFHES